MSASPPTSQAAAADWRARIDRLVTSPRFNQAIMAVILANAVTLGLETSERAMATAGGLLFVLDKIALAVFVGEIMLKLYAWRWTFFKGGWNWFDFVIVAISLAPAAGNLSVLRALRILLALRLLSVVPQMRTVIQGLMRAIPGMTSVVLVLVLVFYVAAVLATKMFGTEPADPAFTEWFGSIGASMYTLFQIMTLESWSMGIVRPVMDAYPWAWVFFVPFIIVTSFAVLNLFIGIVVEAMQAEHQADREQAEAAIREAAHDETTTILVEVRALRHELEALRAEIRQRPEARPPDA